MSRPDLLDAISDEQLVDLLLAVADRVSERLQNPYEPGTPQSVAFDALFGSNGRAALRPLRVLDMTSPESWSESDVQQFLFGRPRRLRGT
jgi:hypothetical protein